MRHQTVLLSGALVFAFSALAAGGGPPLSSGFTFQGQLKVAGAPFQGEADLLFTLWDAQAAGAQVSWFVQRDGVAVENGLFTAELDFGVAAFPGDPRWVQVEVRVPHDPTDSAPYTPLAPRQRINATPYSLHARGVQVDAAGQVAVGGGPPSSPLHVADIGRWNWTVGNGWGDLSLNNGVVGLSFGVADAGGGTGDARIWTRGGTQRLLIGNPAAGDILTLRGTGQVGIGTIDPQYTLDLQGSSVAVRMRTSSQPIGPGLVLQNAHAAPFFLGFINFIDGVGNARGSVIYDASDRFSFYTAGAERMVVDGVGNVGIGTTAPTGALEVHGNESNGTTGTLRLVNGNERLVLDGSEIDSNGPLFIHSNTSHRVVMATGGGDVGIGTGTPTGKLAVLASRAHPEAAISATNTYSGPTCRGTAPALRGVMGFASAVGSSQFCNNGPQFPMGAVWGDTGIDIGIGVLGTSDEGVGVQGATDTGWGVIGDVKFGSGGVAGAFNGRVVIHDDLDVFGTVFKLGGAFKIDHPLDPENKYLAHSFVESPDMMNIYNGHIVTDETGYAEVALPDYFEALNRDFRYQLTVIGDFAQAIVSEKIQNNRFIIRTDRGNVEVSWQVTGVRKDEWAERHRIEVVQEKDEHDRGRYRYPEGYGEGGDKSVDRLRRLRAMQFESSAARME